jgi:antibiotic biosynthesis monooxygenase (ABM) superfamily enzyme
MNPTAAVITRRVDRRQIERFETLLHELASQAINQAAADAVEVLRGASTPGWQDYHIVYRFADRDHLQAWEASASRRQLTTRLDELTMPARAWRRELPGLEAWFDLGVSQPPPSRARVALLTYLGIWPLVSIALKFLGPDLSQLPFLAQTASITGLLVLTMTYAVMPLLTRLLARWLVAGD